MRRLSTFICVLFLAMWLAATQHCNLEAAGLIEKNCEEDCGLSMANSDGCTVVESASYKAASPCVKAPSPDLQVVALFLFVQVSSLADAAEPISGSVASIERPRDWVTSWHFVRRAAPLSRAPSLVG